MLFHTKCLQLASTTPVQCHKLLSPLSELKCCSILTSKEKGLLLPIYITQSRRIIIAALPLGISK